MNSNFDRDKVSSTLKHIVRNLSIFFANILVRNYNTPKGPFKKYALKKGEGGVQPEAMRIGKSFGIRYNFAKLFPLK